MTNYEKLFLRDLDRLTNELAAFSSEEKLWDRPGEVNNSAGNLAMHLCGNLSHFVGHILGKTDYVRNRPFEFEGKRSLQEIQEEIQKTKAAISHSFAQLSPNDLEKTYPIEVFGEPMTTDFFLLHLSGHLNYHLGQISYYRRILDAK